MSLNANSEAEAASPLPEPLKVGLGTVLFATGTGRHSFSVAEDEVGRILETAWQGGVHLLDTAAQAGDSEKVLARCLSSEHPFRIVIKAPETHPSPDDNAPRTMEEALEQSLQAFHRDRVYAMMAAVDADWSTQAGRKRHQQIERLKSAGLVEKIGVSVSDAHQLEQVLAVCTPDIVQIPFNVLDARLLQSGWLARLKQYGIEIHARDIFLQGLLLDPMHPHPWFWPIRGLLERYHQYLIQEGLTPMEGALGFAVSLPEVDYALVGVNDAAQVEEIISAAEIRTIRPEDFAPFACQDKRFIDPKRWNLYE